MTRLTRTGLAGWLAALTTCLTIAQENWHVYSPLPDAHGTTLHAVCDDRNFDDVREGAAWRTVAVGQSGLILVRSATRRYGDLDLVSRPWDVVASGTQATLWGVAGAEGFCVAVGEAGTVLTSPDSVVWTQRDSGTPATLLAAARGAGLFVAVGEHGVIITSPDGIAWTARTSGVTDALRGITFDGARFVAVGDAGRLLISADGVAWNARATGTAAALFAACRLRSGPLVVVGDSGTILVSTDDGATWSALASGTSRTIRSVLANGDFAGDRVVAHIADGPAIDNVYDTTDDLFGGCFRYYGSEYSYKGSADFVGRDGRIRSTSTQSLGITGYNSASAAVRQLNSVFLAGRRIVAVGPRNVVTGPVFGPYSYSADPTDLSHVVGGGGVVIAGGFSTDWVAVLGSHLPIYIYFPAIEGVLDTAESWRWRTSLDLLPPAFWPFTHVAGFTAGAYGNGKFLLIPGHYRSEGSVRTSTNGWDWTVVDATGTLRAGSEIGVVWTGTHWIALNSAGWIGRSLDGSAWETVRAEDGLALAGIAADGARVVAVGADGAVLRSADDGTTWANVASGTTASLHAIAVTDGVFVAVGARGTILRSTDGMAWKPAWSGVSETITAISADAGLFAAVTEDGRILTSGRSAGTTTLANLSARALAGSGNFTAIAGFVLRGTGTRRILVRAVGPGLRPFGVAAPLPNPQLVLHDGTGTPIASNEDWDDGTDAATLTDVMRACGAFALAHGSRDAAMLVTLEPGLYTAHAVPGEGTAGVALLEIYEADAGQDGARLVNLSSRAEVRSGDLVQIGGLVITGTAPQTVLIRAAGPALQPYGVAGFLADPQITLMNANGRALRANDNWEDAPNLDALVATSTRLGAFSFALGSRDAALLAVLSPGTYTVICSGVGGTAGVALVEVYRE